MGEILHAWKWVFSTSHDPRAPSLKLYMVAPFFLSKIALDLVDFATATRAFAATTFEGSHSVRLLENICDKRIMNI